MMKLGMNDVENLSIPRFENEWNSRQGMSFGSRENPRGIHEFENNIETEASTRCKQA